MLVGTFEYFGLNKTVLSFLRVLRGTHLGCVTCPNWYTYIRMQVICVSDYHLATPALAQRAQSVAIYKDEKFSDHAPITVAYDGLI